MVLGHIPIIRAVSMGGRNTSSKSYVQEFQGLNSFPRTDSNKTPLCLGLVEYSRTVRFSRQSIVGSTD